MNIFLPKDAVEDCFIVEKIYT